MVRISTPQKCTSSPPTPPVCACYGAWCTTSLVSLQQFHISCVDAQAQNYPRKNCAGNSDTKTIKSFPRFLSTTEVLVKIQCSILGAYYFIQEVINPQCWKYLDAIAKLALSLSNKAFISFVCILSFLFTFTHEKTSGGYEKNAS